MVRDIVIRATLEGEGQVTSAFRRMGDHGKSMSMQLRQYGRELAALGGTTIGIARVAETFGLLSKEQAGVIREMAGLISLGGSLMRTMGYLAKASWVLTLAEKARGAAHLFADTMAAGIHKIAGVITSAFSAIASSSIAVAIAEKARAIAHAIANAVSSWGIATPILIAAAATVAAGVGAYFLRMQQGGIVYRPTLALVGERGPEAVVPLGRMFPASVSIGPFYISGSGSGERTAKEIIRALRRAGVI